MGVFASSVFTCCRNFGCATLRSARGSLAASKYAAQSNAGASSSGVNQPEAIALYEKAGYRRIENYGPYANNEESICMGKSLPKN
jgi:ribosomal protein S18 acetylase RimI-like enzyme